MPIKRDEKGRFIKGSSGGSGRPRADPEVKELLKSHALEAAQRLIELMRQKSSMAIAKDAAIEILNRTQGKPEMMSKVELTTQEDTTIIFKWINENSND